MSGPRGRSQDHDDLERKLRAMDLARATSWILCEVARRELAMAVDGKERRGRCWAVVCGVRKGKGGRCQSREKNTRLFVLGHIPSSAVSPAGPYNQPKELSAMLRIVSGVGGL